MSAHTTAKRAIKTLMILLVLPVYGLFLLLRSVSGSDSCFASFSQALSLVPGRLGTYTRAAFYRLACPETSDEIVIGFLTVLSHRDTTIRRGVYIGPQCNIGMCYIGEDTLIGSGVHVLSGSKQHAFTDPDIPIQQQGGQFTKIRIGGDCWIGNGALLMAPLAEHSVVAAGSVVTKEFASGSILAGNPAARLKSRFGSNQECSEDHV